MRVPRLKFRSKEKNRPAIRFVSDEKRKNNTSTQNKISAIKCG